MNAGTLSIELMANVARIADDMNRVQRTVGSAMSTIEKAAERAKAALGAIGFGLSAGALAAMVKGAIDAADGLKDLSKSTSVTISELSGLNLLAKQTGTDLGGIAKAINKMSVEIGKAPAEFKALGITATDNIGRFKQLADIFNGLEDVAQRNALAQKIFGKSWEELAPALSEGSKGIADAVAKGQRLSGVTAEMADKADEFNDRLAELGIGMDGFKADIATSLLPLLNQLALDMQDVGDKAEVTSNSFSPLAETFRALIVLGGNVSFTLKGIGNEIGGVTAQMAALGRARNEFLSLNFKGAASELRGAFGKGGIGDMMAADATKSRSEFDAWEKKILDVGTAAASTSKAIVEATKEEKVAADAAAKALAAKAAAFLKTNEEAIKKEAEAYASLITAIRSKTEENRLEMLIGESATESQKTSIKLDQDLAAGKLKLSSAHLTAVRAALAEQAATESLLKTQNAEKDVLDLIIQSTIARNASKDALAAEYAMYGKSSDAREIAMIAIKSESELEKTLNDMRKAGKPITDEMIAQLRREKGVRDEVEKATMAQSKALSYAQQLADENKKFGIDYILDDKARAAASLAIEADLWAQRIQLAGDGTEAQKLLQSEYSAWYKNQLLKPQLDADKKMWDSVESTAHDTFISIFDSGKSAFDRLRDTLKNGLLDLLYQMTIKKWIFNIGAAVTGTAGVAGAAQAAGGSAAGSAVGSMVGGLFGAGGMAGSLMAGAGWLTGASTLGGSLAAGASLVGTGTVAGGMAGAGMIVGALAPIALGIAAAVAIWKKLDTSGTYHTGGASSASSAGVNTIRAESLGFEATRTNADTEKMTAGLVTGIVGILDSTALAFGKTAGYTAATAFADDTSKDGAWGGLVIDKLGQKIIDWQDTKTGAWAPKVFSDGDAGKAEYLAALSASVRTALDGIGLPSWAKTMLDGLGAAPAIEDIAKVVDSINITQRALVTMGERMTGFANLSDDTASALIKASGGIDALTSNASAFYDIFYTEGEKAAATTKRVTEALAAVGVVMPATQAAYRAELEAKIALGAAGAPAAAAMLSVASAFAQVVPALDATAAAADRASASLRTADDYASAFAAAGRTLQSELRNVGDIVQSLADRVNSAAASLKSSRDAISSAYFGAQDAAIAAQKRVNDLTAQSARAMETFGVSIRDFMAGLNADSLGSQSLSSLNAKFSATAVLAKGGDTKSQSALIGIAGKLADYYKANSGSAAEEAIGIARVKSTLGDVATAIEALAAKGPASVDPMVEAQRELTVAQDRLLEYAALASVTGSSTDRASQITAGSTSALLAAFNAAQGADNAARTDYATALTLTSNLALTSTNSLSGLMAGLQTLSTANTTFIKARDDLAAYVIDTAKSAGNLDEFTDDLVTSLGLTGDAATTLAGLLADPGTAATTLAGLLGSGAVKVDGASTSLTTSVGTASTAAGTLATAATTAAGAFAAPGTAASTLAAALAAPGTAAATLAAALGSGALTTALGSGGALPVMLGTGGPLITALGAGGVLAGALGNGGAVVTGLGAGGRLAQALGSGALTSALGSGGALAGALGSGGAVVNALGTSGALSAMLGATGPLANALGTNGALSGALTAMSSTTGAVGLISEALKGTGTKADALGKALDTVTAGSSGKAIIDNLGLVGTAASNLATLINGLKFEPQKLKDQDPQVDLVQELTENQKAVANSYNEIFGHIPDAAGLRYWADAIGASTITMTSAATQIAMSAANAGDGTAGSYTSLGAGWSVEKAMADDAAATAWLQSHNVPGFAGGGDFGGGLRIVGENGPELEATGPSRIWNAGQTRQMMGGDTSRLEAAVERLTKEVESLRAEQRAGDAANVSATKEQTRLLRDVTDEGTALITTPAT